MIALFSFLIVILFSLIIVKTGAVALEATGLSKEIAKFQAQSAFSGVGFTTSESESLMNNSVRRKVLKFLMLMGSAGLTSAIATLILTFINTSSQTTVFLGAAVSSTLLSLYIIVFVLVLIFLISKTKMFDKLIRWFMNRPLHLIKKKIALYDYETVLGLSHGFHIVNFDVPKKHWMVNKTIEKIKAEKEGVIILGIYRTLKNKTEYLGIPSTTFKITNKDKIVAYGKEDVLSNFAKREKGTRGTVQHKEAVELNKKFEEIKRIKEVQIEKKSELL